MRYRIVIPLLLGLVWAPCHQASADKPSQARLQQLAESLLDDRLEVALDAAKALRLLGKHAAPVLPELLQALARELDPHTASLHWHPDQGRMPLYRLTVIGTLEAIGPAAKPAVPILAAKLERARHDRTALVRALLSIAPDADETFDALSSLVATGRWHLHASCADRVRRWVEAQGARAAPMLAGVLERGIGKDKAWAAKRLVGLGTIGDAPLLRLLARDHSVWSKLVIDTFVEAGRMPKSAVPAAIRLLAHEGFDGDSEAYARAIADSGKEAAAPLADALAARELWERPWLALTKASPALAQSASASWFASRRPPRTTEGFDDAGVRRTGVRGGGGGGAFADRPSTRATLVGLRITTAGWSGHTIVTSLQPRYDGPEGTLEGDLHGRSRGQVTKVVAPQGWAIGGLYVKGGHRVDGLAVIFFRQVGDRLDPTQAYASPWFGGTGGGGGVLLGGQGYRIVGLFGRQGADLDAIGLVEAR